MTAINPVLDELELDEALRAMLRRAGHPGNVRVVGRRANIQTSTFPSQVLTCRFDDGRTLPVFCKCSDPDVNHIFGHRSGVAFEAMVYETVLRDLPLSLVRYYGHTEVGPQKQTLLFLEALDEIARVSKSPDGSAMVESARWIARFHSILEPRVPALSACLHRYTPDYYRGWVRRTSAFAEPLRDTFPWIPDVCRRSETLLDELQRRPLTVIHGEYYPKNILESDGRIYPVDWESAAVAAGEIDLASLIENWPSETIDRCTHAYVAARWPGTPAPADFARRMDLAALYLHYRWLGNRQEWTISEPFRWRLESVGSLAQRLGIL